MQNNNNYDGEGGNLQSQNSRNYQNNNLQNYNSPNFSRGKTVGISAGICVFVAILVGIVGFALGAKFQNSGLAQNLSGNGTLDYSELDEIYAQLNAKFDGKLDKNKLLAGAAAGMANATGDPYTTYFTAEEAASFDEELSGSFIGVGIELGQNSAGQLEVVAPLDGSPAKSAGILSGDVIAAINGENSLLFAPEKAVDKIRGKAGTTVKLTILRGGETKDYALTRAEISVPSVSAQISTDGGKTWTANSDANFAQKLNENSSDKIAYLRISQFGEDTATLAKKVAQQFSDAKVKGIILDLRGNGGGYVDAAVAVSSLWLKNGALIVKEIGKNDQVLGTETARGGNILGGIKTVVLIDGGSASASEITAAALKDNNSAQLVGEKSYGKGCMQEMSALKSGAQLKITVANWFTPAGKNITGNGISPDVEVKMTADEFNAGNDTQKNRAAEILNQ